MDFINIRFSNDFDGIDSKIDKTIADLFHSMNPMFSFSKTTWKPQFDIFETAEHIYITGEIAGVEKADLELEINSRAVRIYGKRAVKPPAENGRYRLAEIQYGAFERVIYLPTPVDTEKVTARYKNGFLNIELAKLPLAVKHNIPITSE